PARLIEQDEAAARRTLINCADVPRHVRSSAAANVISRCGDLDCHAGAQGGRLTRPLPRAIGPCAPDSLPRCGQYTARASRTSAEASVVPSAVRSFETVSSPAAKFAGTTSSTIFSYR